MQVSGPRQGGGFPMEKVAMIGDLEPRVAIYRLVT